MLKNIFKSDLEKHSTFRSKPFVFNRAPKLHAKVNASFGAIDIQEAVRCPQDEDLNEWLAVNTVDFFNQTNVLYSNLLQHCTNETCPVMCAGPKYQYLWADETMKKPIKCSAPDYVTRLMQWVQSKFDDVSVFPMRVDENFGPQFLPTVKAIFKRLFRIYSHIYYHHFQTLEAQHSDKYLNMSFKHFVYFTRHFGLIEEEEMKPLETLIGSFFEMEQTSMDSHAILPKAAPRKAPEERYTQNVPPAVRTEQKPPRQLKPKQSILVPSKAMKQECEEKKHIEEILRTMPQEQKPVEFRTKANLVIKVEDPDTVESQADEGILSSLPPPSDKLPKTPIAPPRSKTKPYSPASESSEVICVPDDSSLEVADEKMQSPEVENELHNLKIMSISTRQNSTEIREEVVGVPTHPFVAEEVFQKLAEEEKPEPVKKDDLSMYYDGLTFEKSEKGFLTMSSVGDALQTGKDLLATFRPKIAILGLSWETYFQIHVLRAAGYDVVALWSLDESNLVKWARDLDIPMCFTQIQDVLSIDNLSVIHICDLKREEEPFFLDLLRIADLKVRISISPSALPLARRKEVLQLCPSTGTGMPKILTQYAYRYYPLMEQVKEALHQQVKCGQLKYMQLSFQTNWKTLLDDLSEVFTSDVALPQLSRLVLAQTLDIVSWLANADGIEMLYGNCDAELNSDFMTVNFQTSNGIPGIVLVSFVNPCGSTTFDLEIQGEKGTMKMNDSRVYFSQSGQKTSQLVMEDTTTETAFMMPFQSLSSASLHFFRSLKLYLYQDNGKIEHALSPNQVYLVQTFLKIAPSIPAAFPIMRAIEALKRQALIDMQQIHVVNNVLRLNPRAVKKINDMRNLIAREVVDMELQTEDDSHAATLKPVLVDAEIDAPRPTLADGSSMTDTKNVQENDSMTECIPLVSSSTQSESKNLNDSACQHESPEIPASSPALPIAPAPSRPAPEQPTEIVAPIRSLPIAPAPSKRAPETPRESVKEINSVADLLTDNSKCPSPTLLPVLKSFPTPPPRRNKSAVSMDMKDEDQSFPTGVMPRKFSGSAPNLMEAQFRPVIVPPPIPKASAPKTEELILFDGELPANL